MTWKKLSILKTIQAPQKRKHESNLLKNAAELEKAHIEKFQNRFLGMLGAHGSTVPQVSIQIKQKQQKPWNKRQIT